MIQLDFVGVWPQLSAYANQQKTSRVRPWYELLAQMAGSYWTNEETKALLRIWVAANVQAQLNIVSRKKVVYERVGFYW